MDNQNRKRVRMDRVGAGVLCLALWLASLPSEQLRSQTPAASAVQVIKIAYIAVPAQRPEPLSRIAKAPPDEGIAGARLGIADNQSTGRFTGQDYDLAVDQLSAAADPVAAIRKRVSEGYQFVVVDAPAAVLLKMADAVAGQNAVLFNIRSTDVSLRQENCRINVLHIAPSRAMLADGLAQYLIWKKWRRWFLLEGIQPDDKEYADAIRRSAKRFGGTVVEQRTYDTPPGARRTDSGSTVVQRQMPIFTQGAADHDVVIVADESEVFGIYVAYHTWAARPVAGTSGLIATSWHPVYEQWGATQLQDRFEKSAKRHMWPNDFHAWLAVRAVGEGATRTASVAFNAINDFMRKPEFNLAAFKGQKVNFRPWNGQLRQPIVLVDQAITVSVSPQPGFLHEFSEVDTLGIDRLECRCQFK